jgi:hypothetical protein
VNVQADPRFRSKVTDIRQLQVRNNQGQMVRLGTLLDVRDTSGPVMVMRYKVPVAGGDDVGAAHPRLIAADRLKLTRFDDPEQIALIFKRQRINLVQQEGAVPGRRELALFVVVGPGARPLEVPPAGRPAATVVHSPYRPHPGSARGRG